MPLLRHQTYQAQVLTVKCPDSSQVRVMLARLPQIPSLFKVWGEYLRISIFVQDWGLRISQSRGDHQRLPRYDKPDHKSCWTSKMRNVPDPPWLPTEHCCQMASGGSHTLTQTPVVCSLLSSPAEAVNLGGNSLRSLCESWGGFYPTTAVLSYDLPAWEATAPGSCSCPQNLASRGDLLSQKETLGSLSNPSTVKYISQGRRPR
jgi:hypothetical protein